MRSGTSVLNIPVWAGSAINGTATPCADAIDKTIQVAGTFTATVVIQGTVNGNDYLDLQTFTAPGFCDVDALCPACKQVRVRKTAQTSDTSLTVTLGWRRPE